MYSCWSVTCSYNRLLFVTPFHLAYRPKEKFLRTLSEGSHIFESRLYFVIYYCTIFFGFPLRTPATYYVVVGGWVFQTGVFLAFGVKFAQKADSFHKFQNTIFAIRTRVTISKIEYIAIWAPFGIRWRCLVLVSFVYSLACALASLARIVLYSPKESSLELTVWVPLFWMAFFTLFPKREFLRTHHCGSPRFEWLSSPCFIPQRRVP